MKLFIGSLQINGERIKALKELVENQEFQEQIIHVENYASLLEMITEMETESMSIEQQLQMLETFRMTIKDNKVYRTKLKNSLKKNPDIDCFVNSTDIEFIVKTKLAPLTSVSVGRSFSRYRAFMTDEKQSMLPKSIKRRMIAMCNNDL